MSEHSWASAFTHRHNPDGTFDSICMRCYRTVAEGRIEEQLTAEEKWHICNAEDRPWMSALPESPSSRKS
jgi:hypothetical protein